MNNFEIGLDITLGFSHNCKIFYSKQGREFPVDRWFPAFLNISPKKSTINIISRCLQVALKFQIFQLFSLLFSSLSKCDSKVIHSLLLCYSTGTDLGLSHYIKELFVCVWNPTIQLQGCQSLERIELYDCQLITRAGIRRLKASTLWQCAWCSVMYYRNTIWNILPHPKSHSCFKINF